MNERKRPRRTKRRGRHAKTTGAAGAGSGQMWLYGRHAVTAALDNPRRAAHRLIITGDWMPPAAAGVPSAERAGRADLDALLGAGAVHQGVALLVDVLPTTPLEEICDRATADALVVVLDQVTDPQNVGAVLRAAAAFGAAAVIVQDRHAPPVTGALAKAASGALEHVPLVRVPNLTRALDKLKQAGFWCLGLERGVEATLVEAAVDGRMALILGAEGKGMRRLTRDNCDALVHIPMSDKVESLNVSNAAAVALYELVRKRGRD